MGAFTDRGRAVMGGLMLPRLRTWTVRDFLRPLSEEEKADPPHLEDRPRLVPTDPLETALRAFDDGGFTRLAVFDKREGGVQIGWADQIAALETYNQALIAANVEEHR